jgi:hypothetical protein
MIGDEPSDPHLQRPASFESGRLALRDCHPNLPDTIGGKIGQPLGGHPHSVEAHFDLSEPRLQVRIFRDFGQWKKVREDLPAGLGAGRAKVEPAIGLVGDGKQVGRSRRDRRKDDLKRSNFRPLDRLDPSLIPSLAKLGRDPYIELTAPSVGCRGDDG